MNLKYMPQLDSLRTIAVLFVMIGHYFPKDMWINYIPNGNIGVTLFFVLSGFLISQILLNNKNSISDGKTTKIRSFRDFYIRRTLRIFPIYYILLAILFVIGFLNIRPYIIWYLMYSSNFLFYFLKTFEGQLAHTWTLAVEEQFYLLWPFIILLFPKKYLLSVISFFFLIGIIFRLIYYIIGGNSFFYLLTPSCFDCFACGAFLAYSRIYNFRININSYLLKGLVILTIAVVIFMLIFPGTPFTWLFFRTFFSILSLIIIAKASIGFNGIAKRILENRILVYPGKISYGLYLYHVIVPKLYIWLVMLSAGKKWRVPFTETLVFPFYKNIYLQSFIYILVTIIISSVSWFLIEKPINNLKNKIAR